MLEIGPLVGMIQIPGIKFGVKDVVTLATLNSAIEDVLEPMTKANLVSLELQTKFLAQALEAWLKATGRKHDKVNVEKLDPTNVAYQGRVLVSFLNLLPACIWTIKKKHKVLVSDEAKKTLEKWLRELMERSGLLEKGKFIAKDKFKKKGYLGSGGIGRFRDSLWSAVIGTRKVSRLSLERKVQLAGANKSKVYEQLSRI